jgi:hypothetical protein
MDFKKQYNGIVWIQVVHDRFWRQAAVNILMKLNEAWASMEGGTVL